MDRPFVGRAIIIDFAPIVCRVGPQNTKYTHEEAQMHIKAYAMGKTTAKEVVVKERE